MIVTFGALGYMGEFGNQIFQVAATIGYGNKHNKKPVFPEWKCKITGRDYTQIFDGKLDLLTLSHVDAQHSYDGLKYQEIPFYRGNLNLIGYFQSEKYFSGSEDEIRKLFQPAPHVKRYIEEKFSDILNIDRKVSLHVRTAKRSVGDYDVHTGADREFIEKSQAHFDDEVTYVVFADNWELAKPMLPPGKKYIFVEGEENYVDLFLMNYFDSYIVSPSTFGWWGAWLSKSKNPKVVIKKDWFARDKPKAYLNDNDIPPESWIQIG